MHTEYCKDGFQYRAHPNYQSAGPWYDWVVVKYEKEVFRPVGRERKRQKVTEQYEVPAKLLGFLPTTDTTYAIVHPCGWRGNTLSVLLETWCLEYPDDEKTLPEYDLVDVSSINGHTFVVPTEGKDGTVLRILDHNLWYQKFLDIEER